MFLFFYIILCYCMVFNLIVFKMKQFCLSAFLLLAAFPSLGQQIEFSTNAPRIGDVLVKHATDFFVSAGDGQQALWDFSNVRPTGRKERTLFFIDRDSILCSADSKEVNRFSLTRDSLLLLGSESSRVYMEYTKPQLRMLYPLSYGYHAESPYEARGIYCKKDIIRQEGTVILEVDGEGSVINARGDTLNHVVKVHTIHTGSISMHSPMDSLAGDSARMKHQVTDRNQWFVRGYRYPLYETCSTTYYDGLEQVSNIRSAYVYMPEEQQYAPDEVNEEILDSLQNENKADEAFVVYNFSKTGQQVSLEVVPKNDVCITTFLYSSRAMVYGRRTQTVPAGVSHRTEYNISSLPRGEYVLYVNVNGKVISEKFTR